MRGFFRVVMLASLAATTIGGYRTVSRRRARPPSTGLPEANLTPEQRRDAAEKFRWGGLDTQAAQSRSEEADEES